MEGKVISVTENLNGFIVLIIMFMCFYGNNNTFIVCDEMSVFNMT